jgi:threonine dehydrogenase-like Zn-dependent dehydrogenase
MLMRALTYHGSHDVRVDNVPDPFIEASDDIIIKITATAICDSDLHLYRGKTPQVKAGDIFGHEFIGIVEEIGKEVTAVKKGDRVIAPSVIACDNCFFCSINLHAACKTTNTRYPGIFNKKPTSSGAALFGFGQLYGGLPGGQAEYVRVPKANTGVFKIPNKLDDEQILFLTDILPTGYQAAINASVKFGSSLVIFGAGPIGLMAAASARCLGADKIFMVDHHSYRLEFAQQVYGVIPINFHEVNNPATAIIEQTFGYRGVDAAIDAVSFEAKDSPSETMLTTPNLEDGSNEFILRQCIAAVRRGGTVSVPDLYADFLHGFLLGDAFDKGVTFKMGQTHIQTLLPHLIEQILLGELRPEIIISHRMTLDEAADGYRIFDKKEESCRKVILRPGT